jgi:hypothetical protein
MQQQHWTWLVGTAVALAVGCPIAAAAPGPSRPFAPRVRDLETPPPVRAPAPPAIHPNPRLKLSYRSFTVANVDGTTVPLDGAQLDLYPLSRRWVRAGLEVEGGGGRADLLGTDNVALGYGMLGAVAGFQYPARITPFIEGRAAGGFLHGRLDGTITVPGLAAPQSMQMDATTGIFGRGVDAGAELYTFGRAYLSASIGWVRTTWVGPDYQAMMENPRGGLVTKALTGDSLTFKLGLGI